MFAWMRLLTLLKYELLCGLLPLFSFFFNDTATTEIYTLSLHDALPICSTGSGGRPANCRRPPVPQMYQYQEDSLVAVLRSDRHRSEGKNRRCRFFISPAQIPGTSLKPFFGFGYIRNSIKLKGIRSGPRGKHVVELVEAFRGADVAPCAAAVLAAHPVLRHGAAQQRG